MNIQGKDGATCLDKRLLAIVCCGQPGEVVYLAIVPIYHLLNWQVCPVDRCCLPPYWKSEKDNHSPKRSNNSEPRLSGLGGLGGWNALDAGLRVRSGRSLRRLAVSIFSGHVRDMLCAVNQHNTQAVESGRVLLSGKGEP